MFERLFYIIQILTMIQQTLVVLKPDAIKRHIVGELISRFEKLGLHLVGMKMLQVNDELAHGHYETIGTMKSRYGDDVYNVNASFMMHGPVVAMVWEGVQVIPTVRKIVGATDPRDALPGTIRGDYSHTSRDYANANEAWLPNLVHASSNPEEAAQEIALWFKPEELTQHDLHTQLYVRGHK